MTVTGDTFTTYAKENHLPEAQLEVFHNDSLLGPGGPFEVIGPSATPGGDQIHVDHDWAVTTNAAAYTIGDSDPVPDSISTVKSSWDKDSYIAGAKTYKLYQHMYETNPDGRHTNAFSQDQKAINMAAANMRDLITTTMLSDLPTIIDSTSAFSDGSLARGTYTSLVSYEAATVGTLALADLEDALEALENVTYGPVPRSSLLWIMARNQKTNLSRLSAGATALEYNAVQGGKIDAGRVSAMDTFEGIPILVLPDFSNADILLVNRDKIKIFNWQPLDIEAKSITEPAQYWELTMGAKLVVLDPRPQAKLPLITP
ncbi:MAG: hypothetical protein GY851_07595 [bacterium]|nr:hypothetical protein [bacterium]